MLILENADQLRLDPIGYSANDPIRLYRIFRGLFATLSFFDRGSIGCCARSLAQAFGIKDHSKDCAFQRRDLGWGFVVLATNDGVVKLCARIAKLGHCGRARFDAFQSIQPRILCLVDSIRNNPIDMRIFGPANVHVS